MEKIKQYLEDVKDYVEENGGQLKARMNDISIDLANDYDITSSCYLCDMFTEYADGQVDLYNYDLLEWAKEHYDYVEQAIDEFGVAKDGDGRANLMRTIQSGQMIYYENLLYQDEKEIYKLMAINYMLKNCEFYTMEQVDKILDRIETEIDNGNRADDMMDIIEEVVNGDE